MWGCGLEWKGRGQEEATGHQRRRPEGAMFSSGWRCWHRWAIQDPERERKVEKQK